MLRGAAPSKLARLRMASAWPTAYIGSLDDSLLTACAVPGASATVSGHRCHGVPRAKLAGASAQDIRTDLPSLARQLRRHGIDPAAIRLTLGLAGVISTVGFAVIAAAAVLTDNPAGAGAGLLTSCGSAAAIAFLVIAAVGAPIPWGKLVLVWGAGVGASTFSPTPFGLGVVEVTLIAAQAAAGISSPQAIGAVLPYRIMTFKLAGLIWVMYLHLHQRKETGKHWQPAPLTVTTRDARSRPDEDPVRTPVAS